MQWLANPFWLVLNHIQYKDKIFNVQTDKLYCFFDACNMFQYTGLTHCAKNSDAESAVNTGSEKRHTPEMSALTSRSLCRRCFFFLDFMQFWFFTLAWDKNNVVGMSTLRFWCFLGCCLHKYFLHYATNSYLLNSSYIVILCNESLRYVLHMIKWLFCLLLTVE